MNWTADDSDIPSNEDIAEAVFQMFFDDLQTLKYLLTREYSKFKLIGLSPDQERFIDLFRYHVMKVMQVFSQHPLFHVVYEEDYDDLSSS